MNCNQSQKILANVSRRGTVVLNNQPLRAHLTHCELCRQFLADQILQHNLTSIRVPPLRDEFVEMAIATAVATGDARSLHAHKHWALAAVLLIGILMGTLLSSWLQQPGHPNSAIHPLALETDRVNRINVLIDSDKNLDDVTLSVVLADNIEIEGYPSLRELSWSAQLMQGKNLLTLPLILLDQNDGYVEVSYSDGRTVHYKRIEVVSGVDAYKGSMPAGKSLEQNYL